MKTIEINKIPDSLIEVWEWKEVTSKELYGKSFDEKKSIFKDAMEEAAGGIGAKLIKLPNGNIRLNKINESRCIREDWRI